jgi:hypothetical protein
MNRVVTQFDDRYQVIRQEATDAPLVFRQKARVALAAFTRRDRKEVKQLTTSAAHPMDFFMRWEESLPNYDTLTKARTAKSLLTGFKKHLLLDEEAGQGLLTHLADERVKDLHEAIIGQVYTPNERTAHRQALRLLRRDESAVRVLRESYIEYVLYSYVAKDQGLTVYDQAAPLAKRRIQAWREAGQVRRFIRRTERERRKVQARIIELETRDSSMLASLLALGINLITVRAAYQRYEKRLESLTAKDKKSATKRLALYEKEIKEVRASYLDTLPAVSSLTEIRRAASELDAVLLRVFDMDSRSYNELMSRMKQYRELVRRNAHLTKQLEVDLQR